MKKLLGFLGLAALTLNLTGCKMITTPNNGTDTGSAIKIGTVGPLTGDVASLGNEGKRGTDMYFEKNPTINGQRVETIHEDAFCNGQAAASAAEKLITHDGVGIIFGGGCSGETLAMAPITEKNGVLLFSSFSTSPDVTTAGDYVFRNAPSDEKSTDVLSAELAAKYQKVAIISQNNDFAQAYRRKLKEKLSNFDVEVVLDETFNTGTTDFKTVLQKVKTAGADVLINFAGESSPAGIINRQAAELALDLPTYGNDVMLGAEFFEIAKNAAEGTIIVAAAADTSSAAAQNLLAEYEEKYGEEPPGEVYFLLSYDRADIIARAISEVGYDAAKIKEWLYDMEPYEGLGGTTEFDANGDSSILPKLLIARNGKFELVK